MSTPTILRYSVTQGVSIIWGGVLYNQTSPDFSYTATTTTIPSSQVPGFDSLTEVTIGNTVTTIGSKAFKGCTSLISVTIPNSVTTIGYSAFLNTGLTSVTIPNSVTIIGNRAFRDTGLTSVTIGNSVTSIGDSAFENTGLTSIIIPNSVTSIGASAFENTGLTSSVTIPNSVTTIGDGAFARCSALLSFSVDNTNANYSSTDGVLFNKLQTTLVAFPGNKSGTYTIPNSVTSIGDSAFYVCTGLTSVTIPNSVITIGDNAFQVTGLTSVIIPDSVITIGDSAFANTGLTSVTIPDSVTSIGGSAFEGCTSLTSVTIPDTVTTIGDRAFRATGLTSVIIPDSVITIGDSAFANTGFTSVIIPDSVITIGDSAFENTGLTSIIIPNSVTSIGDNAFRNSGLTSVTIPSSVTTIGDGAFAGCSALLSFSVDNTNANYSSTDGVLFNKLQTTLVAFPGNKSGTYTIPNSVTSIGDSAFYVCTGLTSVTIPNSVITIGDNAFQVTGLTSVIIPDSVITIGDSAFQNTNLTSVTISNSVTTIGDSVFRGTDLTSVTIPNSVTSIGANAFRGTSLTSVTIGNSVTSIGDSAFQNTNLTSVTIGNSVTTIGDFAFENTGLTSVTIPNSVTSIGDSAFANNGFTSVIIPDSVITIGDSAFYACTNLTSVTIGNSVTSIGDSAFGSSGLTSVTIGNSVTSIGNSAFFNCSVTSVTIPYSVSSIGDSAFENTGLTSVTIVNGQIISNITFSSSVTGVPFFGKTVNTISTPPPPAPSNNGSPVISGSALVGDILTTTNGSWTNYPRSYTYQWYRSGSSISGAISPSYTTVEADIGNAITCDITATNVTGSSTIDSSNSINVTSIPPVPPQPTSPPPSQFASLKNVISIAVDSNVEYMYALYLDLNDEEAYIAKINANNGTIINSKFVLLTSLFIGLNSISFIQIILVDNDLYATSSKYIYKITNINTNNPSTPSIWFTSNVTTNYGAVLFGLVRNGTYIYATDLTNKCIMQVSLASSGTSSNTPWATLAYNPLNMTINNGYMYVTCTDDIDGDDDQETDSSYISKISISNPSTPNNTWVTINTGISTTGVYVYVTGLAIYQSYMYVALNYILRDQDGGRLSGSYISLIYLSNGEGILQNPNWVTIPNQFLSSLLPVGITNVIITEKNQNVKLYTCDDIVEIPLYSSPVPPVPPISDICFPAGTPITTDQGIIAIEKINPSIHTINKKPIVDIIRTIYNDKYLIGFKKNAISINCPSQFTVMTKNHKIIWQGRKLEAESFLYRYENVVKVKYSGQILYNVLMEEHSEMVVNNMLCETLDPNNTVAKLYKRTSKYTTSERYKISKFIADSVKNTKFDRHKTYRNIIKKL